MLCKAISLLCLIVFLCLFGLGFASILFFLLQSFSPYFVFRVLICNLNLIFLLKYLSHIVSWVLKIFRIVSVWCVWASQDNLNVCGLHRITLTIVGVGVGTQTDTWETYESRATSLFTSLPDSGWKNMPWPMPLCHPYNVSYHVSPNIYSHYLQSPILIIVFSFYIKIKIH